MGGTTVVHAADAAAMIPFSMMKAANPPQDKGAAAGVMNFLVFGTADALSPSIGHEARLLHSRIDSALASTHIRGPTRGVPQAG
jgi:hypothetical protein